jgi:predicted heme/steroid binding protein
MAKISTYPIISVPTLNDLLIGTDVENINETKNFTIEGITNLILVDNYVPYTGATRAVDLGIHSITASAFIVPGGLATQFVKADGSLDSTVYQVAGDYITGLSGEATALGPGVANVVLDNGAVIGKVLTGLTITGGSVSDTDTILQAFGKVQNQINSLVGGVQYQGTWNAATNTPTLQSGVGSKGYYYVVSVAGNTILDGISDWNVGDWAIFDGVAWQQVDNTDTVVSVNGKVGVVVLTTTDIAEGTNLYYTDARVRQALSLTTTGSSGAATYDNLTGAFNIPNYTLSGLGGVPLTRELTINGTTYDLSANRSWSVGTITQINTTGPITGGPITTTGTIGITQSGASSDGYLSSIDWNTFNNKQNALTNPVTGTGTVYTLPMWSGLTTLMDSPLSYASNVFTFQYNSATGGTVVFANSNGTAYSYTIQMNNFGTPRSTIHQYTDGQVAEYINGVQVSRMFQSGNLLLGVGVVDPGRKLSILGDLYIDTIVNATTDTDRFIVSDAGVIKYRTGAQLLSDIGGQGALTLTTIGSSGPSTLIGNTLNIPDYGSVLIGYVPYTGATQNVDLGEWGISAGYFQADLTPTQAGAVGRLIWNDQDGTLNLGLKGGNVTLHIGQQEYVRIVNGTGINVLKANYQAVKIIGAQGQRLQVSLARADNDANSKDTIGLIAENINNNNQGFVISNGVLENIDTTGALQGETWSDGDTLYLSGTTFGRLTNIKPIAPTHTVILGFVVYAHQNQGKIFVKVDNGYELEELHDVNPLPYVNNGVLYRDTAVGLWRSATIATLLGYTPANQATTLTINGTTFDLSANRTWNVGTVTSVNMSVPTGFVIGGNPVTTSGTLAVSFAAGYSLPTNASQANWDTAYNNRITSLTTLGTSGAATLVSNVLNIPIYQAQGNYITSLTGEATASGPGAASVTLSNSAVTGKVLTGLTVTGTVISAADSILSAFGKLQGQVNALMGGLQYQGTWNAATNTPTITSGVGTDGHFYIVSVAGTTNIDGITDWQVGDWIVFHDTAWQKVDNTDSVISVNGFTGAVTLTTSNISEGTNLYFTNTRARQAISLTTTGNSGASTYDNGTGVLNVPQYTLGGLGGVPTTRQLTINGTAYDLSADRAWSVGTITSIATTGPITGGTITTTGTIGITQATSTTDGYLSAADWNTFNNKQNALSGTTGYITKFISSSNIGNSVLFENSSAIGLGTASINASALFQMDSTTKGFLPSRMTQAQRQAIAAPAEGLIVYQIDSIIGLYIYSNSVWRSLTMV